MSIPVFKTVTAGYTLAVFGKQTRLGKHPTASIKHAISMGADPKKICVVYPPSGPGVGFRLLKMPDYRSPVEAEGVWLREPGSAALIPSGDCPIVLLENKDSGDLALFHAGRAALSPPTTGCISCDPHVVENALPNLLRGTSPHRIKATIVASICGACFKHEKADHLVAPFDRLVQADDIFFNRSLGQLDLKAVIRHYLELVGVPKEYIAAAQHCTLEHPHLSSYRAGHGTRNITIAVKH